MRRGWLLLLLAGCQAVFRLDPVGLGGDGGGGSGTAGPRLVFVTSKPYPGDLTSGGAGADALATADSYCQGDANTAKLPGFYRAWLSSSGVPTVARMTHTGGPFTLPDGTEVAADWGTFAFSVSGGAPHLHPIDETAYGMHVTSVGCDVWTNTQSDGTQAQSDVTKDCYDWTTIDQGVGWPLGDMAQTDARFTADYTCPMLACTASARLYCVQQ